MYLLNDNLLVDATSKGLTLKIAPKCNLEVDQWDNETISKLPQDIIDNLPYNGYNDNIELYPEAPF